MTFKVCTRCKKQWDSKEAFIKDMVECKGPWMGLVLYNCACGTTLGIEEYPGSNKKAIEELKARKKTA